MLFGRKECEDEERRVREDIERLRLAEATQLQQEEKERQVIQELAVLGLLYFSISVAALVSIFLGDSYMYESQSISGYHSDNRDELAE